jgi:hypothetical protein
VLSVADNGKPTGEDQLRALYEQAESATAQAMEDVVAKRSFGRMLAMATENVAALTRMTADLADLTLRNLRIASRADITRLARALGRTEDKLERVLQEIESLRDELAAERSKSGAR